MSVPVFRATRARCAPALDGDIRIEFCDAFTTDAFRTNAGPAEQRTEMFAGYDDEALHLAFICHESAVDVLKVDDLPCPRRAILRARYSHDDSIQVLIDPCRDGVHYRQFGVGPAGRCATSIGQASPDALECDYEWRPHDWRFHAAVHEDCWTVAMRIPAADLGFARLADGDCLGFTAMRERGPEPAEIIFLTPNAISWTTQWTDRLVYEPIEFGVLSLGAPRQAPRAVAPGVWSPPPPERMPEDEGSVRILAEAPATPGWERPHIAGRDFWAIHFRLDRIPGMADSRLTPFSDEFGWTMRSYPDASVPLFEFGTDEWKHVPADLKAAKDDYERDETGLPVGTPCDTVFLIKERRYLMGECLPPNDREYEGGRLRFEELRRRLGERLLGYLFFEWDSDTWTAAAGMIQTEPWRANEHARPALKTPPAEAEQVLHDVWRSFADLNYDSVVPVNCWRCIDHYAHEYGARAGMIEVSVNGNPSLLTQLAFARGAARQYGRFFGAYHATMMSTSMTDYLSETGLQTNIETDWHQSPHCGPSASLYRRLLFTTYLNGATFMSFEHPYGVHLRRKPTGGYETSPHGEALADLLEYDRQWADRGEPYHPIAVALDYLHGFAPPWQTCFATGRSGMQTWFNHPYERGDHQVRQLFRALFPYCRQRIERNGAVLVNTPYGAMFDALVVNPPSGPVALDTLANYGAVVLAGAVRLDNTLRARLAEYVQRGGTLVASSLTYGELPGELRRGKRLFDIGGVTVTAANVGRGRVIATPESDWLNETNEALPVFGAIVDALTGALSPVRVEGDVHYQFLKTRTGWLVVLMNHAGILHHPHRQAQVTGDGDREVLLVASQPVGKSVERLTGSDVKWEPCSLGVRTRRRLAGGEIQLIEITAR